MSEYPQKETYRLSEVCQYTDTQPYVLRFWESEFPQLKPEKSSGGQRVYTGREIELVRRIKELLYDEEYTLEGARRKLKTESSKGRRPAAAKAKSRSAKKTRKAQSSKKTAAPKATEPETETRTERKVETATVAATEIDTVPRQRYQDAIDEIDHLRLQVKEAEKKMRRAEAGLDEAKRQTERQRQRADLAIGRLEKLLEILS